MRPMHRQRTVPLRRRQKTQTGAPPRQVLPWNKQPARDVLGAFQQTVPRPERLSERRTRSV